MDLGHRMSKSGLCTDVVLVLYGGARRCCDIGVERV